MLAHEERLAGVCPELVSVVIRAGQFVDVLVLEGLRTVEREKQLIAQGASHLKDPTKCRHVTGHAVDLAALVSVDYRWEPSWAWPLYEKIALEMKASARALAVPIEWGGDWAGFRDGTHFQVPEDLPCSVCSHKSPST